jgi:hypothetical protein
VNWVRNFILIGAAVCLTSATAFAQSLPQQSISFHQAMLLPPIVLSSPDGWYDEGELFVDLPMQPSAAFVLAEPLGEVGSEIRLEAGTQMVAMIAEYPIVCSHVSHEPGFLSPLVRVCIGDSDKDGSFEHAWSFRSGSPLWEFSGRVPEVIFPIANPELTAFDPDDLEGLPRLQIYSNHMALRRRPRDGSPPYWEGFVRGRVQGPNAGGRRWFCLAQDGYCPGYRTNSLLGLGRMIMRVVDVQDERIRVEILSNFKGEEYRDLVR